MPPEIEGLVAQRDTAIVLTAPWHERDARRLVARFEVPVHTPRPDTAEDVNPRWIREGMSREQVVEGLRPLLDLPVEHLLETHGGPFERAALERALADEPSALSRGR